MIADVQTYTYVYGHIADAAGVPISGVTITMILVSTGKVIVPPLLLTEDDFNAETDQYNASDLAIVFKKKGFKTVTLTLADLDINPNVTLQPGSSDIIQPWMMGLVLAAVILYHKKKKKKVGKLEKGDLMAVFLLVGGVIAFSVVQKILEKLGLWGGGNVDHEQEDPESAWKPQYWKQFTSFTYAITTDQAKYYSYKIHNAFTVFQDDWNVILGVFSQMKTKANVSYLADIFNQVYGEDLLGFLTDGGGILPWDGLSKQHMDVLINMVQKLPKN